MAGRKFAVFDIDGTLIRWQLYHAVADALVHLGFVEPGAYDSIRAARMNWKTRKPNTSFLTYEQELIRVYEAVLTDLSTGQLDKAVEAVFEEYKDQVYTYTRQLVNQLKSEEYFLLAISGSQEEIVRLITSHYGFDDSIGTIYHRARGRFSGQKTYFTHDKAKALHMLVKKHKLNYGGSIGVGDGASDISMLEQVETPVAFNPERTLFEYASEMGWKIVVERKNMVYEFEKRGGRYELAKTSSR